MGATVPFRPLAAPRRFGATSVSALALALALTACAGGPSSNSAKNGDQSPEMLLKVADETAAGDPASAIGLYQRMHETKPKDPVPLGRLGAVYMALRDYDAAAAAYHAALALAPDDADLHRDLALALLTAGRTDPAMNEINGALAKRTDDPRLYNLLGVAQDMTGHHDLAQESYRHGLDLAPASIGLHNNLAMSLALAGDYAGAVTRFGELAGPSSAPRYRLNLALAYGLSGDETKAADTARQVLDEQAVQNNLAYYSLLRGMSAEQRTVAILGAELHGTALSAAEVAAVRPGATMAAGDTPVPAPRTSVAVADLPPMAVTASGTAAASPRRIADAHAQPHATDANNSSVLDPAPIAMTAPTPLTTRARPPAADPVNHTRSTPEPTPVSLLAPPPTSPAPEKIDAAATKLVTPAPVADAPPPVLATVPTRAPEKIETAAAETATPPAKVEAATPAPVAEAPPPVVAAAPSPAPEKIETAAAEIAPPPTAMAAPAPVVEAPPPVAAAAPSPAPEKIDAAAAVPTLPTNAAVATSAPAADAPPPVVAAAPSPAPEKIETAAAVPSPEAAPEKTDTVAAPQPSAMAVTETSPPETAMAAIAPTKIALAPKKEALATPAHGAAAHFTVQLGSYQVEETAHKLADRVTAGGLAVTVSRSNDREGRTWFVVRSGDFASAEEAAPLVTSAKALTGQQPVVVHLHATAPSVPAA